MFFTNWWATLATYLRHLVLLSVVTAYAVWCCCLLLGVLRVAISHMLNVHNTQQWSRRKFVRTIFPRCAGWVVAVAGAADSADCCAPVAQGPGSGVAVRPCRCRHDDGSTSMTHTKLHTSGAYESTLQRRAERGFAARRRRHDHTSG